MRSVGLGAGPVLRQQDSPCHARRGREYQKPAESEISRRLGLVAMNTRLASSHKNIGPCIEKLTWMKTKSCPN